MPISPGLLTAGLSALGLTAGAAALYPTAKNIKGDADERDRLKASFSKKTDQAVGAALAGLALAGTGGYVAGKTRYGTYKMLPEAYGGKEKFRKFRSALHGRTGFEYLPEYKNIADAGDRSWNSLQYARNRIPQQLLDDVPDYSRNIVPYTKQSGLAYLEMLDKLGLGYGTAALLGTAIGGTALGAGLYGKHKLDKMHEENKKKLHKYQTLEKYLVPGALAAGAIIGGIGGGAIGKASGKRQMENYRNDMYNASVHDYYTNAINNRVDSYKRAEIDLARKYMNEGDNSYGRYQNY